MQRGDDLEFNCVVDCKYYFTWRSTPVLTPKTNGHGVWISICCCLSSTYCYYPNVVSFPTIGWWCISQPKWRRSANGVGSRPIQPIFKAGNLFSCIFQPHFSQGHWDQTFILCFAQRSNKINGNWNIGERSCCCQFWVFWQHWGSWIVVFFKYIVLRVVSANIACFQTQWQNKVGGKETMS